MRSTARLPQTAQNHEQFIHFHNLARLGCVQFNHRADTMTFADRDDLKNEVRVQANENGIWIRVFTFRSEVLCYELQFHTVTPLEVLNASLAAVLKAEQGGRA